MVPNKPVYTVGRLSTDLILGDDLSISRTHVRICLPSASTGHSLTVEDLGSKYGTFINNDIAQNKKMKPKTPTALQVGDKIRFGALKNVWQLTELKLATTPSSLLRPEVEELSKLLSPLGGNVLPNWTNACTHLTMDMVSVTVKLLHALLENKPVVCLDYWREFSKVAHRIHVSDDWPKPEDFPPDQTADMPSIKWHQERSKLFAGKTFVFCNSKHNAMYGPVVEKAGGACKDLNSGVRRLFLTKSNVVVIQYISTTQSQGTETIHSVQGTIHSKQSVQQLVVYVYLFSIIDLLEKSGLRLVPDYEIGLAILHCSTAKFCNPSYKMMENSLPTTESMNSSIIVPNTERTQTEKNTAKSSEYFVPDSSKSEAFQLNLESEQPAKEAVTAATSAPVANKLNPVLITRERKRNNAIYLDSSDEEIIVTESPKKPKTSIDTKEKSKRKHAIIVDSSDEEVEATEHSQKKTKPSPEVKELPVEEERSKPVESPIDEELVNISQLIKKKTNQEKLATATSSRRSTRANQVQQQTVEKPAPASPRRSLRGKQSQEKPQSLALNDEDSEEEGLFQFKSRAPVTVTRAPFKPAEDNQQSTEKTLPTTKTNQPGRISVRNFLEKSQNQSGASQAAEPAPATSQPRKRLRLEQLNESDSDDNENLFKFGGSKKPRQSIRLPESDNDSDDAGMFNFKSNAAQKQNRGESENDQDSVATEPFIANTNNKSRYIVPKPKELPRKVNVSGWLSCSRLHGEVKPEPAEVKADAEEQEIKVDADEDDEKLETMKWVSSIKDCIQVRMCNLNISVRSQDDVDATVDNKYSGRKNFKKFVKVGSFLALQC